MRTVAVLPVKRFDAAKQRLAEGVTAGDRRALAGAMVADVLDALAAVRGLEAVLVVTAEPLAATLAEELDMPVIDDPEQAGQSAAAARGVAAAAAGGAERALLVPGDCPALDPAEVEALLARPESAVIVPDRHGTGTNALLLSPPDLFAPAFGPGSFERHSELARRAGARPAVATPASLTLDVDTPGDLAALRAALARRPGGAARTRAALGRILPGSAAVAR
jgi:2-phospho-L-lactate/phosphoenolpyruvate guanylyltransferase